MPLTEDLVRLIFWHISIELVVFVCSYKNGNFAQISSQTESDSDLYLNAETDVYASLDVDAYETKA